jgi:hypothetical protein
VLHSGPGIRGGGAADIAPKLGRHAHFDELPSFKAIATALGEAKKYLPPGLANWTRRAPNAPAAPLQGFDGLYSASKGSEFVALAIGIDKPMTLRAHHDATIDVRQTTTGQLVKRTKVSSGETLTFSGHDSLVFIGHVTPR